MTVSGDLLFSDHAFEALGPILLERTDEDKIRTYVPQGRYKKAATSILNAYGAGPFCKFKVARHRQESGLYILTKNDDPVYFGETDNVGKRWGFSGYGGISPRNCYVGGQSTNCRINAAILSAVQNGDALHLWFF